MEIGGVQGTKIGNYTSAKDKTDSLENVKKENENKSDDFTGTIQGSELNLTGQQDTTLKKLLAQKAAWQLQLDQFDAAMKIDDVITGHETNRDVYKEEALTNQKEVSRLNGFIKNAKEGYGVEDDSTEQKDLELLQKQLMGEKPLTAEETRRLGEIGPLTEYQKVAMEYSSMAKIFQSRADSSIEGAINESNTITAIKLELLKSHPMIDAKKEAEDLIKQVDAEIQIVLLEEIKKKVSENLNIDPNTQILTDAQALVNQKKVTEEDLKGLAVDEKV